MTPQNLQLRSLVKEDNTLELSLLETAVPDPGPDEVIVRVEATPLNPSDLALLLGPAVISSARVSGSPERPVVTADIPAQFMKMVAARVGQSLAVGNEGAGTVIAAGSSDTAQALLGKTVGIAGGEMYARYRCMNAMMCMELPEGTSAADGASCFVNPMTALGMVETMRAEGHTALVHTAAASNLGQMLNRLCMQENIDLVNIVRKPEQEKTLRNLGAKYVCDSSSDSFFKDLTTALITTGATLAFDATGGGTLATTILSCMETAAARLMTEYNRYGSDVYKQVYVYGFLDRNPTNLRINYGFSWGLGGWLLTHFLQKAGTPKMLEMRARVAAGLKTTFASHYSREISLTQALDVQTMAEYSKQATGEKFLINPQR
ncbi:MAG: zinc-binding dehydrogenase [Xanthomonadales bacterium]|nr:zinc-binding dehydrogenase [Xanthomonadales bacterium]